MIIAFKYLVIKTNPNYISESTSGKYIHSIGPTVNNNRILRRFIKISELYPLNKITITRQTPIVALPIIRILIL